MDIISKDNFHDYPDSKTAVKETPLPLLQVFIPRAFYLYGCVEILIFILP